MLFVHRVVGGFQCCAILTAKFKHSLPINLIYDTLVRSMGVIIFKKWCLQKGETKVLGLHAKGTKWYSFMSCTGQIACGYTSVIARYEVKVMWLK